MMPDGPATNLLARVVVWLLRWRLALFAIAVLLTVAAWPVSRRLAFDQSVESLYAQDDPRLRDFLASRQTFGGDEFLIVAFSESELFEPDSNSVTAAASERITQFADQLNAVPGVIPESTQHLVKALRFPYGREKVRQISSGILNSEDEQTTAIVLRLRPPQESPVSRGDTIKQIRELAAKRVPPAMVVGEPAQIHDMFRYVEEDGRKLFLVSLGLLAFVLFVLLRRVRWVVLSLLTVLISITWTEAILVLSGLRLSMVSSMLNSLMTIIGVATVTHLSLYYREQHQTFDAPAALQITLRDLASPVWWSIATTAMGFGVLVSSQINPVRSFGGMMALGSLVVLGAVVLLIPAGALFGMLHQQPEESSSDRQIAAWLGQITLWVEHHPRQVSAISLALVAFTGMGFTRLRVETDFSKNFRENSDIVKSLQFVESRLGGAGSWEVNFPAPDKLTDEYLDRVRDFAAKLRTDLGTSNTGESTSRDGRLAKVVVLTDSLDLIRLPFVKLAPETRVTMMEAVQPEVVSNLYNRSAGRMRILLRAFERQPSETKLKLIADIERLARETFGNDVASSNAATGANSANAPEKPAATGLFVLLAFLIESLLSDQWTSFFLASIGIMGMMWYAFRSLAIGLISLVPNIFPIVLVIGSMGWIGLPINIATAMIASVSMGLTVDSSIHYIAAYRRHHAAGRRVFEALHETHKEVGRALVYANAALMAGFSVLSLSHFIPLVYFGLLVSLAMFGGLIGNLVFLPLLIGWWDSRREFAIRPQAMAVEQPVSVD